jgi:lipoate-protein ligase A
MASEVQTWSLLESAPGNAAYNMALDEALLEAVAQLKQPILRFYSWHEPAASFGYFQRYLVIEQSTLLRPLVRRPTGGGLVPHNSDWTYSVIFPTVHEWYSVSASESYQRVHQWIQASFATLQVVADLAEGCRDAQTGECFVGYVKNDLLWQGRKIAGAAQRRTRSGLLIQGSIQPPPVQLCRTQWHQAMCDSASKRDINWIKFEMTQALKNRTEQLAIQKYSQEAYTKKR